MTNYIGTEWHVTADANHRRTECHLDRCGLPPLIDVTEAERQTVENLNNELCVGAEPDQPVKTQDELLTALDELLDSALHDPDACYIDPEDTHCACIIGVIRAVLPPCGAVQAKGNGSYWKCHRTAHPASPDRHVF